MIEGIVTAVAFKEFEELSSAERDAILVLLEDEDPAVQDLLVERLVGFGPAVLDWLASESVGRNGVARRRVDLVKEQLGRRRHDDAFLDFCIRSESDIDLEEGMWRLALAEYPLVSIAGYRALIDSFSEVLNERLHGVGGGKPTLSVINRYLFDELEFVGNDGDYFDPENSFLNRVVDRRKGIPISLSVLFLLIAQRLSLPVQGIGMPGHFLCRYQSTRCEYYIDAFNRGRLFSKAACVRFLDGTEFGYRIEYLEPVSTRAILLRSCQNLLQIYLRRGDQDRSCRIQRYVKALSRPR